MDDSQTLSDYAAGEIRATLARRQLTGKELASKLGVSRSWISYRLTGTTEIGLNDLQRIALALDIEVTDLLPTPADRDDQPPRRIRTAYSMSDDQVAPHAPNVRSRANRSSRSGDAAPRSTRPSWTHAGVTP